MKKALLGSTTQRAVKTHSLKVCVQPPPSSSVHYIFFYYYKEISEAYVVCMFAEWLAHENAVFDIAWVPGEPHLVSTTKYMTYHQSTLNHDVSNLF